MTTLTLPHVPVRIACPHCAAVAMVERLVHHCNGGAWAGREQREQIVKDLEAADAVIAKAKWA